MKRFFRFTLACLALFVSCAPVEGPEDPSNNEPDIEVPVDSVNKIACQLPELENGKASWTVGDKILVHGEFAADEAIITLAEKDIAADGKTCYISVDGVTPYVQDGIETKYVVAYPGELVKSDKHCRDCNRFTETNALLLTGYQSGGKFVFEYLVGGFAFTVQGDFDSYILQGNKNEVVGYETLTSKVNNIAQKYIHNKGADKKLIKGNVNADGSTVNHVCFPLDLDLPLGFNVVFYKGETPVKSWYFDEPYTSSRAVFTSFGNITSSLEDYKAPIADTHVSEIPIDKVVDLGAAGTANCYVVNAPGVYSFKAVRGNSAEQLPSLGAVELVWETWGTTEPVTKNSVVAQVDFQKDMIYFRVPDNFHPGNAMIAAKDERGNITWSWHIWVPETPISEEFYQLSRRKVMSRNLGALIDASADAASSESAGLLYQWGRKDPFMGVADFSSGTPASVAGKEMTMFGDKLSIDDAVRNPTAFGDCSTHWCTSNENFWDSQKTMYDPCPPGYKVPGTTDFLPLNYGPDELDGWGYNATGNTFTIGTPSAVFPLGGYLSSEGEYLGYGMGGYLWSCRSVGVAAYALNLTEGDTVPTYDNTKKNNSNGYAVRCLSEEIQSFENFPGTPVKGSFTSYNVNLQELSGLCLNTDNSFLWGVGDQGNLVKLDFDGNVEKVLSKGYDMEGVTINPTTGDLYLGCEANYVYKVLAPDYKKTEEVFRIQDASKYGNSGIEGISWYKDDMLLVGTQTGAYMWACKLDGTIVWRKCMKTVAIGMLEIADICYDPVKDQLWIIDSETQSIYLFNGDANKHLATYRVPFGGNCESVYIDYGNDCVWVADDDDPSVLFKIDFTF